MPSLCFQDLDHSPDKGVPVYKVPITPPKHDSAREMYKGDVISVYIMPPYHYQSLPPLFLEFIRYKVREMLEPFPQSVNCISYLEP